MKSHQRSVSCWIILLAAGVCAQAYVADAGIVLTVRDTISGIGGDSLVAVADLDHDGIRDVVTRNAGGFTIYEQTGVTSAVRFSAGFVMRGAVANDIDGDGNIEILVSPPDTATIYRATGNDTYAPIYSASGGYGIIGGLMSVGDVNGNGNKEFLIPSKSGGLFALESQGGDAFSVIAASNNPVEIAAPTADLDGDSQPEIVAGGDNSVNTYVYHLVGGSLQTVFHSATDGLLGVGDTDGDGRAEIITRHNGFDTLGSLVSDGMGGYVVAAEVALPGQAFVLDYNTPVMDVDGDGVDEVAVVKRSATTRFDELTFWSRSGTGQFHNVFDSGSLFTLSNQDFTSILKIGDTDGNGRSELALLQGGTLYILEATSSVPEPSTIVLALIAGAAVCAIRMASSRRFSIS